MRFFDFSATALVAAAVVSAASPDSYGSSLTSATTTYTITRTVSRVVETLTATRENSTTTYESTSSLTTSISIPLVMPTAYSHASAPSVTIPSYGNATTPLSTGTGALPSSSASFTPPAASEGGAGKLSIEGLGLAAIAGVVGLLAF